MFLLLLAVWLLNAFDLALTLLAESDGLLDEGNPIARAVLARGVGALFVFKVSILVLASGVMYGFRRYRCTEIALFVVFAAYTFVAVKWHVCYALYEIGHSSDSSPIEMAWLDSVAACFSLF